MRRDDLLKPDVMSEVILLGAGALVLLILILILEIGPMSTLIRWRAMTGRGESVDTRRAGRLATISVFPPVGEYWRTRECAESSARNSCVGFPSTI